MTFTIEDAENDGYLKSEIQTEVKRIATRESPKIMEFFEQVCEDLGADPGEMLADMVVQALNDEGFANRVAETEISLRQARINDIREEDLELVERLHDKFGPKEDKGQSTIETLIEKRLQRTAGSPLQAMRGGGNGGDKMEKELLREIRDMRKEMNQLKMQANQDGNAHTKTATKTAREREDEIDDLFSEESEITDDEEVEEEEKLSVDYVETDEDEDNRQRRERNQRTEGDEEDEEEEDEEGDEEGGTPVAEFITPRSDDESDENQEMETGEEVDDDGFEEPEEIEDEQ